MMKPKFHVGQKVLRNMGVAGGFWEGVVRGTLKDGRVRVLFGGEGGITIPFQPDEHLIAQPTTPEGMAELRAKVEEAARQQEEFSEKVSVPLWPKGAFGPETRR